MKSTTLIGAERIENNSVKAEEKKVSTWAQIARRKIPSKAFKTMDGYKHCSLTGQPGFKKYMYGSHTQAILYSCNCIAFEKGKLVKGTSPDMLRLRGLAGDSMVRHWTKKGFIDSNGLTDLGLVKAIGRMADGGESGTGYFAESSLTAKFLDGISGKIRSFDPSLYAPVGVGATAPMIQFESKPVK